MSDNKKMMEIAEKIIKEYSKDFNTDIIDIYRVDFEIQEIEGKPLSIYY